MARSKLDEKQVYEYLSKVFLEKTIVSNRWKYRTQEKDNDIDGEIEIFSDEGETTAKIIKVQLKATNELKYSDEAVIFDCPMKFLNFCDVCDIPVILVIYGVEEKKAYWLWTQKYIFQALDSDGVEWRKNTSTIRVKIPTANEVKENARFYNMIESISKVGVNELQQWRKQETSEYYFTILEEKDNSTGTKRRISAKIYIERSFASSKDSLVELVKKVNEKVKNNNYFRKVLDTGMDASKPEYIWLYFYDDLIQYEFGLPMCKSEWINNNGINEPILLKEFDQYIDSHNIRVKWEDDFRPLHDYLLLNSTSKTDYLKKIRGIVTFAKYELDLLIKLFNNEGKGNFYNHINAKRSDYRRYFLLMSNILPPYECRKLNRTLYDVLTDLDNLAIAIEQKQGNEYYLNSQYIKKFALQLAIIEHEVERII
ncbi:DUF4365 domain-containing protein [Paenibacillus xerothermodurans]|uniref:DUF4365 domain-containing protein n=1 Tax=Paenibacillus xerothermodurans TaxID=1977292 RepID=A0A2W1NRD8_PAEXE|nr:DUF4365 domain-containing protein [Paenibacillus xerothermodurans]PZE20306.1 DUF4365 domain-containing protein [Paenibacillus xerothermodurans]